MVCSKCGAFLEEGYVYCPKCGKEAQIVSEKNLLEDDLLLGMMDEGEVSKKKSQDFDRTGKHPQGRPDHEREKKVRQKLIFWIVLLVLAVAAVFGCVMYHQNHSVDHLLTKAKEQNSQKHYQEALGYLDRIFAMDEDQPDALLLAGEIHTVMNNYEQAEAQLLAVLAQDPLCEDAYRCLIEIYEDQDDEESILALMAQVTDADILALFESYIVEAPQIDTAGGSYSEYITVEISAAKRGLEIYYTLDGSVPTKEDTRYEDPIEIDSQGKTKLRAVCMNAEGKYSEVVSETYQIELDAPDMPEVSPDGGRFLAESYVTVTVPKGTDVYYTWDGSEPNEDSDEYTEPILIPEGNNILSLIAVDENGMKSTVLKCNYIYYPESGTDDVSDQSE